MGAMESLEKLIAAINSIFPEINLQRADYSSYIIKNISPSDCNCSIRYKSSNQYHIAITGTERMSIFPLITDYNYLSTHNTAYKHKFTFKCPIVLYLPNLITKAKQIWETYDDISAGTKYAFKEKKSYYESLVTELTAKRGITAFKKTFCNIAYNERGAGQKQLEIGRSDDDMAFLSFRRLCIPGDQLIILKREHRIEYIFLLVPDGVFKSYGLNEIDTCVEIPASERVAIRTLSGGECKFSGENIPRGRQETAESPAAADNPEPAKYHPVNMSPEQIIFFGAPGTGKSFDIGRRLDAIYPDPADKASHTVRVTFHPDYEYSDFVGTLRPVRDPEKGLDYKFAPGPILRILAECFKHPAEMFFLIAEEINRGNAPAVFGDLFQLLDRDETGKSRYLIDNEDAARWLRKKTGYISTFADTKIWFPPNLSILCSMNTADQNVFVLDTAFTRRFDKAYVRIDFTRLDSLDEAKKELYLGEGGIFEGNGKPLTEVFKDTELLPFAAQLHAEGRLKRNWPTFALLVNRLIDIVNEYGGAEQISEDKKLGPFFAGERDLSSKTAFVNKVAYYLKQDVFRYTEQYFNSPFQEVYDTYSNAASDLFAMLKTGD